MHSLLSNRITAKRILPSYFKLTTSGTFTIEYGLGSSVANTFTEIEQIITAMSNKL